MRGKRWSVCYVDVVYGGRVECGGLRVECVRIAGSVGLLCVLCIIRYTMRCFCRGMIVLVPYAMVELRSCCGYAVARDVLLRFVAFSCILYMMIPYARRGGYGAFMSFLQGVFCFVLAWCVKSLSTTVESLEGLWWTCFEFKNGG